MMYSSNYVKRDSFNIGVFYDMPILTMNCPKPQQDEMDIQVMESQATSSIQYSLQYNRYRADEIVDKAKSDAVRIISEAQKKADEIVALAEQKAQEIYSENYQLAQEKGYTYGIQLGKAEAQKETEAMAVELCELSKGLEDERKEMIDSHTNLIIDLAAQIAQKVVCDGFMEEKGAFLEIYRRVVKELPPAEKLTLTIADKDYQIMSFDTKRLEELAKGFKTIELHVDHTAPSGTLKLETSVMMIDASINTQIGLLKKKVVNGV